MAKWRVYNRHPEGRTHKEKFQDSIVEIKAGEYVLMDYEDAVAFRGQYFPMFMNAQGVQDPASYKCIEIVRDGNLTEDKPVVETKWVCHFDGKEFPSKDLLMAYIEENFKDKIIVDEVAEKEVEEERRSRGRPRGS